MCKPDRVGVGVWLAVALGMVTGAAGQPVVYVDGRATGANDGSSWTNAFVDLRAALEFAQTNGVVTEVRVAVGAYVPAAGTGDRTASFVIVNGVAIRGGYAGLEGADPDERNLVAYETVLSGDLAGNDASSNGNAENSYHVVRAVGVEATAVLDGFTVRGGRANGSCCINDRGAGLYCNGGGPTIVACRFESNRADDDGGGIYSIGGSPTITACTFDSNTAHGGAGIYVEEGAPSIGNCRFQGNTSVGGGGIRCYRSTAVVTDCVFEGNSATYSGGGVYNSYGAPTLSGCTISGNAAVGFGGGMYNFNATVAVANCTFFSNTADDDGGAVYIASGESALLNCRFIGNVAVSDGGGIYNNAVDPTVTNCAFSGNMAGHNGGGAYNAGGAATYTNSVFHANSATNNGGGIGSAGALATIANCIFRSNVHHGAINEAAQIYGPFATIGYSCVQGWTGALGGVGNFDADPLFFDPVGADGVIGTLDDNLRLDVGSPCIDAGNNDADIDASTDGLQPLPATDLDGNPRIIDDPDVADTGNPPQAGAIIDLGPHEHLTDDCNGNGAHDSADIGSGTSSDCNANLLPDECDIRAGTSTDCNTNGQPDECDITSGQSRDFDGDGLLDECDPDVDNDGVANESDVCNETAAGQPVNPRGGPMGDVTDDCVVTLADHYYFEFCLGDSGPAAPPLFLECVEVFDFDADGDVDLRDYASFQRLFGAD